MRAETQVKIGRRTAIVLVFLFLMIPPLIVYDKIQTEEDSVNLQQTLMFLGLMYVFLLPLVFILGGYAWAVKHNRQKIAIALFVIHAIWALLSIIFNEVGILLVEFLVMFLLLQGILGIRKLQARLAERSGP